ncbi:hypothetical protein F3Y22_tig00111769pilonHSYRG00082 [Hibiscus syriacus]|uniref:Chitin-binding type-1 domain-containing protein n=1 Tax=Hibiscus syriacus TaxID=106335 RepID=A0A6A2YFS6_HIBSY|nr:hypothetical protein F3Y22_tig00111769pilonHSYRG00082 [Hibiscus syriacus]
MVKAQCGNGCAANECCSTFGYCGTGPEFCGANCQGGLCSNNGISRADIATPEFFNAMLNQGATCPGKNFYSRGAFLDALDSLTQFARTGSVEESRRYYGCGPLQLSWNYNYGPAGSELLFDGLGAPETVASDPLIAFKAALWFWTKNVAATMSQGFGATIRAINPIECNGAERDKVQFRIDYFTRYCNQLNVAPGDSLTC